MIAADSESAAQVALRGGREGMQPSASARCEMKLKDWERARSEVRFERSKKSANRERRGHVEQS